MKKLIIIIFVLIHSVAFSQSIFYVSESGNDINGDGSQINPWATITHAIGQVSFNDTIYINGTITEDVTNGIALNKNLTLKGNGVNQTIVQSHTSPLTASNRVFQINGSIIATIKDITIRNGNQTNAGGAIIVQYGGELILQNCSIENNYGRYAGAIFIGENSSSTIENCTFFDNSVDSGGGEGGAIYMSAVEPGIATLNMFNCTISSNDAGNGGGFHFSAWPMSGSPIINVNLTNCTIADNTSSGPGNGITVHSEGTGTVNLALTNCIVSNGINNNYYTIGDGTINLTRTYTLCSDNTMPGGSSDGNIDSSDPLLSTLALNNSINGTYTHHIAFNSPARDSGTSSSAPTTDQRGAQRNGLVDMGSYEFWSEDAALPVELSVFTAYSGDSKVILRWSTASELDNDAFILERSEDKENFRLLTEIKGQGSTSNETNYEFTDNSVFNGFTYYYRLADRDINGVVSYHTTINATPNTEGIDFEKKNLTVTAFDLHNNFPNPFNPETVIRFDIPTKNGDMQKIKLSIYNNIGQLVNILYDGQLSGGKYDMKWNASKQASGIYYLVFQSEQYVKTKKMVLIR